PPSTLLLTQLLKARRSRCGRAWNPLNPLWPERLCSRLEIITTWSEHMIISKKHLSRRTFLRGAFGATIALPMLDAMAPALTAQGKTTAPFRFGVVYFPCGIYPKTWHPDAGGSDFTFKPVMAPLESVRSHLVTVSNMTAPWGESVHVGASTAFLNGVGPAADRESAGNMFG